MNSDEEAFNQFIFTSDDDEPLKENAVDKRAKTNRNQFNLMIAFSKDMDEQTMKKEKYDEGWNDLADKLNELGPPIRDSWGWRRVWSVYKHNQKRKQPATRQSAVKRRSCPDRPHNARPLDPIATSTSPLSEQIGPANIQSVKRRSCSDRPHNVRPLDPIATSTSPLSEQIGPANIQSVKLRSCSDRPHNVRPLDPIATSTSPLSEQIGPANIQSVKLRSCSDRPHNVRPLDPIATSTSPLSEQIGPANIQSVKRRSCSDRPHNVRPLDPIATSSSPLSEQIAQSVTVPVMAKLNEIANILTESNQLLKRLADK